LTLSVATSKELKPMLLEREPQRELNQPEIGSRRDGGYHTKLALLVLQHIVFGGGLPRWCVNSGAQQIPLVKARYGAEPGIAGGAAQCAEE
jgi:hypothetical protein